MSATKHIMLVLAASVLLASALGAAPALADEDGNLNIICEDSDETTDLGSFVATIMTLLVTLAALVAVLGGAGFTLASAARPTNEEYVEKRNKAVLYGGGALIVLYAANALMAELSPSLDFGCALPLSP